MVPETTQIEHARSVSRINHQDRRNAQNGPGASAAPLATGQTSQLSDPKPLKSMALSLLPDLRVVEVTNTSWSRTLITGT